jgi:hypothetical protein
MAGTIETLSYRDVAKAIDHSLLRPELDLGFVADGVELALRYGVAADQGRGRRANARRAPRRDGRRRDADRRYGDRDDPRGLQGAQGCSHRHPQLGPRSSSSQKPGMAGARVRHPRDRFTPC